MLFLLQCNGKHISWSHLRSLYFHDSGRGTGLALLPKLKSEHINLTAFSKMRVDLAAQVGSMYDIVYVVMYTCIYCSLFIDFTGPIEVSFKSIAAYWRTWCGGDSQVHWHVWPVLWHPKCLQICLWGDQMTTFQAALSILWRLLVEGKCVIHCQDCHTELNLEFIVLAVAWAEVSVIPGWMGKQCQSSPWFLKCPEEEDASQPWDTLGTADDK